MGFLWNKNKHDLCPDPKDFKTLITNYLGGGSSIKTNCKVTVPEGFWLVLGRKGKVADKFDTGEHFLNFSTMPYMCRRFAIDKIRDGKQASRVDCECYFVSKDLRAGKFKTYRQVEMGTRAYGIYKMHVYGMYSYKVTNAQELMQSLLNEYDYIKTGEAEDIIDAWVEEIVVSTLEKKNFVINDVVQNNPIIVNSLKEAITKVFNSAGIELCELKIYKYKLPKQYQAESDKVIAEQMAKEQKILAGEQTQDDAPSDVDCDEMAEKIQKDGLQNDRECVNTKQANAENIQPDDLNSCQNIQQKEDNLNKTKDYQQTEQVSDYVPFGNFKINKGTLDFEQLAQKKPEKTFVDLSLNNLYEGTRKDIKRCLNCGAENDKNADHCILCGEKFVNNEEI